jgi:ATP-dependent Lon protease
MKLHIAKNYLIPDICKDVGIKNTDIIIPDDVIINIILNYTNEGGVRKLKEKIYKIIRELNHCNLTNNKI